jgi:hypothetical protein
MQQPAAQDRAARVSGRLVAEAHAASNHLLPRLKHRDPGPTGALATPHDQELGPAPSPTRDDASASART